MRGSIVRGEREESKTRSPPPVRVGETTERTTDARMSSRSYTEGGVDGEGCGVDAIVQQVTLVVKDQTAALDFYVQKVSFEKKTDFTPPGGRRWVTVGPRGQNPEFALFPLGSPVNPEQKMWAQQWVPGKAPPTVLRVKDCKAIYEELRARGVEFLQPPVEYAWGTSATFVDPDGNLFSLNQPPSRQSWP